MNGSLSRRGPIVLFMAALLVGTLIAPAAGGPDHRQELPYGFQGEHAELVDHDARPGRMEPTAAQVEAAERLDATVRWNRFGTPHVLTRHGGWLATGLDPDPVSAARSFLRRNAELFRLSVADVDALEVLRDSPLYERPEELDEAPDDLADVGHAVLFRQRFGELAPTRDGTVTVGVKQGKVAWVSSTVAPDAELETSEPRIDAIEALTAAAADVDLDLTTFEPVGEDGDWQLFSTDHDRQQRRARLTVLPTPTDGARLVWETLLIDGAPREAHPYGWTHYVDATDGRVWLRTSLVDHLQEEEDEQGPVATWSVFPAYPNPVPADGEVHEFAHEDLRLLWCWYDAEGCGWLAGTTPGGQPNGAARAPWDVNISTGTSTFTTSGNYADTAPSALSPFTPDVARPDRPVDPERTYEYEWTDQWYRERCNPNVFLSSERNDIDAATVNLFVGHNRMHDWAYYLGFTEVNSNMQVNNFGLTTSERANDPEMGDTQAGYITGSANPVFGRDNANQITPPDGIPTITNQYLWQPIANAVYVPCVDGAYDMAVVAHEYTHAITNRMTAGPYTGLSGHQAGSMGESWSDLNAMEILQEYSSVPVRDENPYAVGAYVTGDPERGVRNYSMHDSPLNYSDVGYDFIGPQVHADGEIWSATQFQLRQALVERYDAEFPSTDAELQHRCADGEVPVDRCPGNRVWAQILHDSFLLQPSEVSMVDARDAMLAADQMRFDGAHQDLMWEVFAQRGFGEDAESPEFEEDTDPLMPGPETQPGTDNTDPIPSFASPNHDDASVTFEPRAVDGGDAPENVRIYVGDYEARATPIADTDPETELGATAAFVPGTYDLLAVAEGFGFHRFTTSFEAGERTLPVRMARNLASVHNEASAEGDGLNLDSLIDDTESTNWASLGSDGTDSPEDSVEGRKVTVDLAGDDAQRIDRVQVSAMLRPTPETDALGNCVDEEEEDCNSQNRFSALRAFEIQACNAAAGDDCSSDDGFETVYTSPADAFPGVPLRPRVNDLTLRAFDIPDTDATHVRLRVLTNQCTGQPLFQGELDDDPSNETDCVTGTGAMVIAPQGENVRAAELQVFAPTSAPPAAPGPPAPAPSTALPTTGGGPAAAGLAILGALGAAAVRRRR